MEEDDYEERSTQKRKRARANAKDDEDEFVGAETKKPKGLATLTAEEKERIVSEVVRYLIFWENDKSLSKRADISKTVLQQQGAGGLLSALLPEAQTKLKQIFGWELAYVPTFTPKGKMESNTKTDTMLIRRSVELDAFMSPIANEFPAKPNMAFLMIVLSIIMMHNFTIEEDLVLTSLEKYGLGRGVPHEMFGKKTTLELIKELAKLGYLSIKKEKEGAEAKTNLNIGPRSLLEIGKVNILRFVNEICNSEVDASALREYSVEQLEYMPEGGAGGRREANRQEARAKQNAAAVAMATQRLEARDEEEEEEEGGADEGANNHRANGTLNGGARGAKAAGKRGSAKAAASPVPMDADAEPNGDPPAPRRSGRRR